MRRARTGASWIAMMDLLFGLFGALVLMSVLITLKLGRDTGVDTRPFFHLAIEVSSDEASVRTALQRMHIGVDLQQGQRTCHFGPLDPEGCNLDSTEEVQQHARFASISGDQTGAALQATLFFPLPSGGTSTIRVSPTLRDLAMLMDGNEPVPDGAEMRFRLTIRFGRADLSPEEAMILRVDSLLNAADDQTIDQYPVFLGASLNCPADRPPCSEMEIENGVLLLHP